MRHLQKYSPLAIIIALLMLMTAQVVLAAEIVDDSVSMAQGLRASVEPIKIERSKPLAEELAVLLGGKFKWSMEHSTVGLRVGPMDLPGSTLENVLRRVLNAASADYRVLGDSIVVFKLPNCDWNKIISLDARGMTLEKAVNSIFSGTGINGSIEPSVSQTVLNSVYTQQTLGMLMNTLFKDAGVGYKVENDTIKIFGTPGPPALGEAKTKQAPGLKLANADFRKIMETPLYLEFVQMPLNSALEAMLRGTGLNYTVSPDISAVKVNATLKNVTLERALREVINAVGADYKISNNTVRVTPPMQQSQGMINQMQQYANNTPANSSVLPGNAWASNNRDQKLTSKSIPLRNVGAADVAPAISQPGMQVSSTNSKNIVITGSAEQVKQAENLISALDNDQNLPKQVRITIAVKVKNDKSTGPRVLHSVTLCTPDGEPATLETNTTVPRSDFVHVINNVTPTIAPDGRIGIDGYIKLNWRFKDASHGEINYISPEEPFEGFLIPGKEQVIAELKIGGGIDTVLNITAVAAIEKAPIKTRQR